MSKRLPLSTRAYIFAWRYAHKLPDALVRSAAHAAADVTWLRHGARVRQLEKNLQRIRPDLSGRALRRTSRAGMRSYLRYFVEAFQLPGWSPEQVQERVRTINQAAMEATIGTGSSASAALGHSGNWDLAGAWASRVVAPVLTVAEKLPDGLYEEFHSFREGLGMTILPLEQSGTFRGLLRHARQNVHVVCLLADRDLTRHGIEVDIAGHRARVAAGPAALALAGNLDLYAVSIHYERLTGERRRAAGSPWGIVIEFIPIPTTDHDGKRRSVEDLTQAWVTALFERYTAHPQDWHMLQKVFLADLDPARLAAQQRAEG